MNGDDPAGIKSREEREEERVRTEEIVKLQQRLAYLVAVIVFLAGGIFSFVLGKTAAGALSILVAIFNLLHANLVKLRKKYCEVEVVESSCANIRVGTRLCSPCPAKGGKCPSGTMEVEMWDLPPNTPTANPDRDSRCKIRVRFLHEECRYICKHHGFVPIPVRRE